MKKVISLVMVLLAISYAGTSYAASSDGERERFADDMEAACGSRDAAYGVYDQSIAASVSNNDRVPQSSPLGFRGDGDDGYESDGNGGLIITDFEAYRRLMDNRASAQRARDHELGIAYLMERHGWNREEAAGFYNTTVITPAMEAKMVAKTEEARRLSGFPAQTAPAAAALAPAMASSVQLPVAAVATAPLVHQPAAPIQTDPSYEAKKAYVQGLLQDIQMLTASVLSLKDVARLEGAATKVLEDNLASAKSLAESQLTLTERISPISVLKHLNRSIIAFDKVIKGLKITGVQEIESQNKEYLRVMRLVTVANENYTQNKTSLETIWALVIAYRNWAKAINNLSKNVETYYNSPWTDVEYSEFRDFYPCAAEEKGIKGIDEIDALDLLAKELDLDDPHCVEARQELHRLLCCARNYSDNDSGDLEALITEGLNKLVGERVTADLIEKSSVGAGLNSQGGCGGAASVAAACSPAASATSVTLPHGPRRLFSGAMPTLPPALAEARLAVEGSLDQEFAVDAMSYEDLVECCNVLKDRYVEFKLGTRFGPLDRSVMIGALKAAMNEPSGKMAPAGVGFETSIERALGGFNNAVLMGKSGEQKKRFYLMTHKGQSVVHAINEVLKKIKK